MMRHGIHGEFSYLCVSRAFAVIGNKITVGPRFFNEVNAPIGLALLVLTGICPLLAWRRSTGGNLRRNFFTPGAVGLLTGVGLLLLGVQHPYALLSFSLAAFVLSTIVLEFFQGARVRAFRLGLKEWSERWEPDVACLRLEAGSPARIWADALLPIPRACF